MSEPITLVAGLGRCGSSLVMQMLAAGGMATVGTFPDFEIEDVAHLLPSEPRRWVDLCAGKAVKLLDPQRCRPPVGPDYHAIWLRRDATEQGRSMLKLIGLPDTRENRRRMAGSIRRDGPRAKLALIAANAHHHGILEISFEAIILDPTAAVRDIADYLGRDLNRGAMLACIRQRPAWCLPDMLEHRLAAEAAFI